ncbi:MAG: SWIM zinc finger family protein, partial [Paraburkholderia sp.]|uniref:SWIM zinc finger family protein n=1 Tax=Paraburkholderia sp. TaxID=1926495 RepID=UPI0039792172
MSSVFYDREHVKKWLGARTVEKALDYVDAFSNLHWENNTLSGEVQGTQRHPYVVDVQFHDIGDDLWVEGDCSCPVGFQCKHMAALLIAGL